MTNPTTALKHLFLAGGMLSVLLFSLLLPAKLTYAADLFNQMMGTDSALITPINEEIVEIEKLRIERSSKSMAKTGQRRVATGTNQITISPNSAVANAGDIPVVITSDKPFLNPVTPTNVGSFELQYVVQGDDNTIYGVLDVSSLSQGTHDLTVNNGGNTRTLSDAFTVSPAITPQPYLAMVYMACDNNLASSCERLFNNLELAASNNSNIRIVAFWDGNVDGDSAYYLIQPDNNPYARASYDSNTSVSLGEVDSADPSTLVQFAAWAKSQYPDTYSFLSLVDHGNGWAPDFYPGQAGNYKWGGGVGGLFWDDTSGNAMSTEVLADALAWITQGGNGFDVIYIDACQMSTVEVMAELAPYAEYIIGHENLAWATYPYDQFFADVDSNTEPYDLARDIVDAYEASLPSNGHPAQISVIQSSEMSNVLTELNDFTNALRSASNSSWPSKRGDIQQAVLDTAHVDENVDFVLDSQDSTIDLHHFASQFIGHPRASASVKSTAQNLINAIESAVQRNYFSPDAQAPWVGSEPWDMSNFNGLSIYFPLQNEWKRRFYGPDALPRFAANSTWDEFIQQYWYFNGSAPAPPTEECDPKECIPAPMHNALTIDEDDVITDTGRIVWVPVSLLGADKADDIRGVQISVNVQDTSILVPVSGLKPRQGDLFPTDAYTRSVATTAGWDFLITDVGSSETISGTGQVVQLPFRFLVQAGCQDLEFSTHIIRDSAPNKINHYHEEKGIKTRICHSEVGTLDGVVILGKRAPGYHDQTEVKLNDGTHEAQSDIYGKYSFPNLPNGSYSMSFANDSAYFLRFDTTVNINGPTSLPDVTLCAGDMDHDDDIDIFDEDRLALGILPVGFPAFDLNADRVTDVGDLIILQQNIGKESPNDHCGNGTVRRPSNFASEIVSRANAFASQAQPHLNTLVPVPANPNVVGTLRAINIDFNESDQPEGLGTRIELPAGATVNNLELIGHFAGGLLDWQQVENNLYIIATFPEGSQLATDSEIARFEMSVPESGNATIEGINPAILRDNRLVLDIVSETTLYLPLMQR